METKAPPHPYRILILDTETNGLPKDRKAPPAKWQGYPAILQLAWEIREVLYDCCSGEPLLSLKKVRDHHILLDPGIPWDTGAAAIHGITEEEARNPKGRISAHEALHELTRDLYQVDCVLAHNLAFDKAIIEAACYRIMATTKPSEIPRSVGWPPQLAELCTMAATRDILKIPATAKQAKYSGLSPYKSPSLRELYVWLHDGEEWTGATHSALGDVDCLGICAEELLRRGILEVLPEEGSGSGNERALTVVRPVVRP